MQRESGPSVVSSLDMETIRMEHTEHARAGSNGAIDRSIGSGIDHVEAPSGATRADVLAKTEAVIREPRSCSAVSLFAGCGGSDLGMRQAGAEVVWANEKNPSAAKLYETVTNSQGVMRPGPVEEIGSFPEADLLAGCYPCQGYSQGGCRKSSAGTNYLYQHFDRALRIVKPRAFIVENVNGMRFKQNQALLRAQIVRFRLAGYRVSYRVMDAAAFGLPQNRKRLFIVGIRSSEGHSFHWPQATHGPDQSSNYVTQRDAIYHLREDPGPRNDDPFHWYYLSRNRRRPWDQPSATVVARDRHVGLHPDSPRLIKQETDRWIFAPGEGGEPRRLSVRECAVLQGFSDPTVFENQSVRLAHRAIGNAVPPPLFNTIASNLITQLGIGV